MTALELAKSTTKIGVGVVITPAQWELADTMSTTDLAVMIKRLGVENYSGDPLVVHAKAFLIKRQLSFITIEFVPDKIMKGRSHYDQNADGVDYTSVKKFRDDLEKEAEKILETLKPVYSEGGFFNIKPRR